MKKKSQQLYLPIILGTTRKERMSRHVAAFVLSELKKIDEVKTELIDVCDLNLPMDDAGETIKNAKFSRQMTRADGVIIVAPEYNHGYPGILKHALDTNLKEYIHKAAGICGVSSSEIGGVRMIQNLLPVLRELGLTTIFYDGYFPNVAKLFDEKSGKLLDNSLIGVLDLFFKELIWMANTLRDGRENTPAEK